MTFKAFAAIARTVHYKPGWRILVTQKSASLVNVFVSAWVQNAYPPHHMMETTFQADYRFKTYRGKRRVIECVKRVLFEAEDHEFAEFFRIGKRRRPYNPHA